MDDNGTAIRQSIPPGEVMEVLDRRDLGEPGLARHPVMDHVVVGGGEAPGQLHREPVFLSGLARQWRGGGGGGGPPPNTSLPPGGGCGGGGGGGGGGREDKMV